MRLAAIDIGSNSIHMIVARIDGDGNIDVIDKMKVMAKLGEETLSTGYLSEAAQERGLDALRQLKTLADHYRVDDTIAVATSATREARNGSNFIERVADEVGVRARIITGIEEGRLIYLGTREVFSFGDRRALIIDIGGGSVEFVLADQRRDYIVNSLKLGVRRIRERFLSDQPVSDEQVEVFRNHVRSVAERTLRLVRKRGYDLILGTSGTSNALWSLARDWYDLPDGQRDDVVNREELAGMTQRLLAMKQKDIESESAIEDKRRTTIVPGAILMLTLVEMFGAEGFQYCDAALREGMIVDYLERNRPGLRLEDEIPDPRRRSVMLIARRFYNSTAHPQNVARLAVRLFDNLYDCHKLGAAEREWLEYAAYLHNVGNAINRSGHHKHSLYIIMNADLAGFTDRERAIIANVARYHRRSAPKSRHDHYMELAPEDREVVKKLSCLIRLANALDRGHSGNVHSLEARMEYGRLVVRFMTRDDPTLELSAARAQREYVGHMFGLDLDVATTDVAPKRL